MVKNTTSRTFNASNDNSNTTGQLQGITDSVNKLNAPKPDKPKESGSGSGDQYADARKACAARGGIWDSATNSCKLPSGESFNTKEVNGKQLLNTGSLGVDEAAAKRASGLTFEGLPATETNFVDLKKNLPER